MPSAASPRDHTAPLQLDQSAIDRIVDSAPQLSEGTRSSLAALLRRTRPDTLTDKVRGTIRGAH